MSFTDHGLFEHDQAFDDSARVSARQAVAVAHKRAKDRFGSFLKAASADDFHQRFALIEDELAEVVAETSDEYGADESKILAAVTSVLAAGGFCDECRKWKSGPKKGCECSGKEPSAAMADDDKGEDQSDFMNSENAESAVGSGSATAKVAQWTVLAEALTTEKLPTGDDTALGGPSPEIDKKTWKPNALNPDGNLSPIDTEGAGSPHPTVHQDISDIADHTKDPHEQTDAVLDHVDVGKEQTIEGTPTDTWSGTDGFADPVTSAAQDVERNPLRTMIEQGALPQTTIDAAISSHVSDSEL